jgi:hypothetical protein
MRFFLPLILALVTPTAAITSKTQSANIPANPSMSQEINSLNAQRAGLESERKSLTERQDFWHNLTIILGVIAALIGILAGGSALLESRRSYALRGVDARLAVVDGQISEWKKRDADWRIEAADLRRVALENRILDIFGGRELTVEQSARIATNLAGLNGAKIDVFVYALGNPYSPSESHDSRKIGTAVVKTLRAAGIDAEGWLAESCWDTAASNLVLSVSSNDPTIMKSRRKLGTHSRMS